ncbi:MULTISPECIES: hypothetical protein [Pseudonocardia]|uniref:Fibronectin type-III domain-containing protein n=2 Tax=Pseudonocardia TaxID=1847 RepID=A0A1Y2N9F6_PSEAH|nr:MULTISPECIES: hypothetical protein [Pseudonocardia]OSY43538.1 hypothetical protein BG845_00481 [Pseudonocardia autotrophica]TDN73470.1 hypothetical protein C8E95_2568 [Pseudonocardia autotrophica]BBG04211.1 hypothetical protein Pdca_54200 [Pseudonocardia autotrophica]GEC29151.1 hypothetical protein PSA01_61800 [Pseudonocardia saturnea]
MSHGASIRPFRAVGIVVATLLAILLAGGTAAAAPAPPPVAPTPPGPVGGLTLTAQGGQGARTLYFDGRWDPPADPGTGAGLHYTYEVRNAIGTPLDRGTTANTTLERYAQDRCTQPYTVEVSAVTQDPATGEPLVGPASTATLGATSCQIHSSLTARQTGPGTVQVDIARAAPVDPYVAGRCVLTDNGREVWAGTCGGIDDESATLTAVAPGEHDLVLTTRSPNGQEYPATTSMSVR